MPVTYQAISTQTLAATSNTVTFSSIPSGYSDLRVVADCFSITGSDYYRINGVTGANYAGIVQVNYASVQQWSGNTAQEFFSNSSPTLRQQYMLDIFDYNNTGEYKGIFMRNQGNGSTTSGSEIAPSIMKGFGYMNANNNAITSVSIMKFSGHFYVGSVFTLFGILKA